MRDQGRNFSPMATFDYEYKSLMVLFISAYGSRLKSEIKPNKEV